MRSSAHRWSLLACAALGVWLPACTHSAATPPPTSASRPALPHMEPPAPLPPGNLEAERAYALLVKGDAAQALALYRRAWELGNRERLSGYNAAIAAVRLGAQAEALSWLERSVENGYRDVNYLRSDKDLEPLRSLPEFTALLERIPSLPPPAWEAGAHPELKRLVDEDQADRRPPPKTPEAWKEVSARDAQRRQRVDALIAAGEAKVAADFFAAALVYQHGKTPEDHARARELAAEAARRGHPGGMWLAAAAWDRWLMNAGLPQRFGTQYKSGPEGGPPQLYPVDPSVPDSERQRWGFPPLAEIPKQL
jgi:tetratricopeptide (TPR) repeat protein